MSKATEQAKDEATVRYPLGPYYVGADDALDCPPHKDSGLALVETGRSSDWPVARLCEWPMAERIALALNSHDELLAALKAVQKFIGYVGGFGSRPDWWTDDVAWRVWVEASEKVRDVVPAAEQREGKE